MAKDFWQQVCALMLDSINARLLKQPSLVNVRKRALLPVVRERTQLGDAVARYLAALGLERRVKPVTPLHEYLASRAPVTRKSDKKIVPVCVIGKRTPLQVD